MITHAASSNSSELAGALHPYSPPGITLPGYVANTLPTPVLLAFFTTCCTAIWSAAYIIVRYVRPNIPKSEMVATLWFILCGFVHLCFEGYFAYSNAYIHTKNDLFGQLWKEYSLSDSRYLSRDSFIVCMEAVTAVCWGPLSFLCAVFIVADHPLRHPLQMIVSMGQLYGDVLYYATSTFQLMVSNLDFCRSERIYFWAYYVMMNAFWIVIPFWLIMRSVKETRKVFEEVKRMGRPSLKKDL